VQLHESFIFKFQHSYMKYIIAIDLGTTHFKAITVNENANTIQSYKARVTSFQPQEGFHEQDAEKNFEIVVDLVKQSIQNINHDEIVCISFSAAMHSLLAVDESGKPLTNAMTWADTRSKKYAQQLRNTEHGKNIYKQTGTAIHAMSPLCKIMWLKNEQPELFAKTYKFISIKEYIFYRLSGKFVVDVGIASSSGLYDVYNNCWFKNSLQLAGIDENKLSKIVAATHFEKELLPEIQDLQQLKNQIPFVCGGNDGCLANLGCGALETNEAALTVGTSGAIRVTIPKPEIASGNGLFRYLLTDKIYVTGGPTNNGGIALQWFSENFLQMKISTNNDLNKVLEIASQAQAASDGVCFLPYLLGERAPVWDEDACGMFFGLRMQHKKEHLTRAVVEGISFSLLQILKNIEATGISVEKIYVSGVVTQSNWWMQLLANMFGKKILLSDATDASAMGAAFIGMYATGMINDLSAVKSFVQTKKEFLPDAPVNKLYSRHYEIYTSLYPATQNVFKNSN
jgi:gluconokinase